MSNLNDSATFKQRPGAPRYYRADGPPAIYYPLAGFLLLVVAILLFMELTVIAPALDSPELIIATPAQNTESLKTADTRYLAETERPVLTQPEPTQPEPIQPVSEIPNLALKAGNPARQTSSGNTIPYEDQANQALNDPINDQVISLPAASNIIPPSASLNNVDFSQNEHQAMRL